MLMKALLYEGPHDFHRFGQNLMIHVIAEWLLNIQKQKENLTFCARELMLNVKIHGNSKYKKYELWDDIKISVVQMHWKGHIKTEKPRWISWYKATI